MNIRQAEDVLKFWQEVWGTLQPIWHKKFLKHRSMKEILTHPSDHIKVAIRRNPKLADVASDLRKQVARTEEFLDKYDKYRNSREVETGSKIENREREGNRWSRTF